MRRSPVVFRNLVLPLSFVVLLLLCVIAMATGCGSSNSSSGGGNGPYNVVGTWQANFSAAVGATTTGYGAINSAGLGAFLDTSGNIVQMPTITGANSFSGNLTAYAVNGTFFSGGVTVLTDTAQGTVSSATSIAGSFTGSGTPSGTFSMAPLSASAVSFLGVANGSPIGFVDTLQLTFSSGGSFTGADYGPGSVCNVSGSIAQEGTNNVFNVTYSTVSGACIPQTETGVAFESKTDYFGLNGGANVTYLYMMMLTSTLTSVHPGVYVVYQ